MDPRIRIHTKISWIRKTAIFPVSLPNRDNVDDEGDLVVAQWLEEEKSEFDRALLSINDLTVGHQLLLLGY
jgi:hypothetical protein